MTTEQRAEQRSGFRLPWAANRGAAGPTVGVDEDVRDAGHGDGLARIGTDGWDAGSSEAIARLEGRRATDAAMLPDAGPAADVAIEVEADPQEPLGGWPGRNAAFDGHPGAPRPEDGRFPGLTADGVTPDVAARAQADAATMPVHDVEWPAADVARLRSVAGDEPDGVDAASDDTDDHGDAAPSPAAVDLDHLFTSRRGGGARVGGGRRGAATPEAEADGNDADTSTAPGATALTVAGDDAGDASADPLETADDATATDARVAGASATKALPRSTGRPDSEARRVSTVTAAPATPARAASTPASAGSGLASKFMADLSRAMQAAAQVARDEALARLSADAAARIEAIGTEASTGAVELKQAADEDVTATREWSRAEIARIKEETDRRIADRRARLEEELDEHAAAISRRTDTVREALAGYEAELTRFLEEVLAEEDPTRIATLAQHLPEPPSLEGLVAAPARRGRAVASARPADDAVPAAAGAPTPARRADAAPTPAPATRATDDVDEAEAAALAEAQAMADAEAEAHALAAAEAAARLSSEHAAAAEAEALAGIDGGDDPWFASQGAEKGRGKGSSSVVRSELIVTGLSSVAGIAGFKRELSAIAGVRHVGVSAGHAGEFVFAVGHAPTLDLAGAIPELAAFTPQVHGRRDGALLVAATEPATGE